jgi:1,4-alpha-glucan branching enzyme
MPQITFRFRHAYARTVALAGDFNDWSTTAHPMRQLEKGRWTVEAELPPGRHEYRFVVDGNEWWNDPDAPKLSNIWGTENSFLDVNSEG